MVFIIKLISEEFPASHYSSKFSSDTLIQCIYCAHITKLLKKEYIFSLPSSFSFYRSPFVSLTFIQQQVKYAFIQKDMVCVLHWNVCTQIHNGRMSLWETHVARRGQIQIQAIFAFHCIEHCFKCFVHINIHTQIHFARFCNVSKIRLCMGDCETSKLDLSTEAEKDKKMRAQ